MFLRNLGRNDGTRSIYVGIGRDYTRRDRDQLAVKRGASGADWRASIRPTPVPYHPLDGHACSCIFLRIFDRPHDVDGPRAQRHHVERVVWHRHHCVVFLGICVFEKARRSTARVRRVQRSGDKSGCVGAVNIRAHVELAIEGLPLISVHTVLAFWNASCFLTYAHTYEPTTYYDY